MLEFIVLGQVPGTHLIITFNWVLIVAAFALFGVEIYRISQRRKHAKHSNPVNQINEIAL